MNFKIIGRIMSWILMIEAAFMLPAALVSWIYAEHYAMIVLLICTALTGTRRLANLCPALHSPTNRSRL